jgi:DNA helicase-2/ATP-dependent DNA helicase PcrA
VDIKNWLQEKLQKDIDELKEKQSNARTTSSYSNYQEKIEKKENRLIKLTEISKFSYNPNGENLGYDSLNHSEVISMGSAFINDNNLMQKILINRYPIILIDESQDTKKELVDALLNLYKNNKNKFIIGMFGDVMQRIYTDGKENIESYIPEEWSKPTKLMNHRSAKRIVELANAIRRNSDNKEQKWRSDSNQGTVKLFICNRSLDKYKVEKFVENEMAKICDDEEWKQNSKKLILEHHMAASRLGFNELFGPIYGIEKFKTGILDGTLTEMSFFTKIILPLIEAHEINDSFGEIKILKKYSNFFVRRNGDKEYLDIKQLMLKIKEAVSDLYSLWNGESEPSCISILDKVCKLNLFEIPDKLNLMMSNNEDGEIQALKQGFSNSFVQVRNYNKYISGKTNFATHQGVKGLEFPRVMLVIDDDEAKGFLFSYEKLFGAISLTDTDMKNAIENKDTSMLRTNRLFYVACTRAMESLAVVAYTSNSNLVKEKAIENKWFDDEEIRIINEGELECF